MECLWGEYMATCVPGGEPVLREEVCEAFPGIEEPVTERGKVFFRLSGKLPDAGRLFCADNLYRVLARFAAGPHKDDLPDVEAYCARLNIREFLKKGRRIRVSASRAGKHTYSRFALADAAARGFARQGFMPVGEEETFDTALRIDLKDADAMLCAQMTDASYRFRGGAFQTMPGGIRPTVAAMLVRMSEPDPGDVFLDPFCGAGTLPFERLRYEAASVTAGDIDPVPLEAARINLGSRAVIRQGDATKLPDADGSVTCVVSNIPWGKQIEVDDLPDLYARFAKELARVLAPDGRALLLTDEGDALEAALRAANLRFSPVLGLSLHGLHPAVWAVTK